MANNKNAVKNLTFLKKWETANPNGRPKKGIASCNAQLAKEGYQPATKADIEANYMAMVQLGQEKLTELANGKEQPMLIRIIAKNMLGGKGFDIIEKMLDRWIWKAVQKQETEISGTINTTGYDLLQWIQSGKITRDGAYEAMRKAKGE